MIRGPAGQNAIDDTCTRIIHSLEREEPVRPARTGDLVQVRRDSLRSLRSWNRLGAITRGELRVERQESELRVHYKLWFTEVLVFATIGVIGLFGPAIIAAPNLTLGGKVAVLVGAWLWLVGGSVLVTRLRFLGLLRQALRSP